MSATTGGFGEFIAQLDLPSFLDEQLPCAETDPELFFPDKGESPEAAKRLCATCTAQVACLEYALARREPYGVWGGLSARQRTHLLARRRRTNHEQSTTEQQEAA